MGGLCLRSLVEMNKAYLLKLGWKLKIGDKSLWCQVMREKYDRSNYKFCNINFKIIQVCGRTFPMVGLL